MNNFKQFLTKVSNATLPFLFVLISCLLLIELLLTFGIIPFSYYNSDGFWEERWLRMNHNYKATSTSYPIDKYHPVLGHSLKENLVDMDLKGAKVSSNSQGIRGKKEYSFEKSNKIRILAIGNSFTFGECVSDNETFSAYLEKMSDNIEVINMGVHGYGNDQQLLKLKIEGMYYKPDYVILGFLNDNINRNKLSFRDYAKPKYSLRGDTLVLENIPIIPPEEYKKKFKLKILNYLKIIKDKIFYKKIERDNFLISYKIFEQIIFESRQIKATPVFLYLPYKKETIYNQSEPHRLYYLICNNKKIQCLDPTSRIYSYLVNEETPEESFECHYNPVIHRLIAEKLYDYFNKTVCFECQN